jgi:hypothetical protein
LRTLKDKRGVRGLEDEDVTIFKEKKIVNTRWEIFAAFSESGMNDPH